MRRHRGDTAEPPDFSDIRAMCRVPCFDCADAVDVAVMTRLVITVPGHRPSVRHYCPSCWEAWGVIEPEQLDAVTAGGDG